MTFKEVLAQVLAWLQQEQRVSYRALKRQFALDDAYLEDLKDALLYAHPQVVDDQGRGLLWMGDVEAPVAPPPTAPRVQPDAERRQLTVLFCDLVDSTTLAQQLDPEDYRAVVRAYQEVAVAAIQPFGGYVAQYLGDGLLVYFGYPQAHEDAAQRAVRSGLAIVEAMAPLNTRLAPHYGVRVAVRLGLHTGVAVVGTIGSGARQEQLAMGDTPNIAARLQGLAAPDTVVLSAVTARLVQRRFALETLGTHPLKGVTEPMLVFQVLGVHDTADEEEASLPGSAVFLVGRGEELGLLRRRWEQSKAGLGQVVLLRGEAGIGKSSLVEVLRAQVRREGSTRVAVRCSPYHTNSALYPVMEHVQRVFQWQRDDTPAAKLDKLEHTLRTYSLPLEDVVPLFAALLSLPLPEGRYPALRLTPQQQKQQTQDALVAWMLEEAERQPVLVVWEDLHWADPSTLEYLGLLLDQSPTSAMLNLLTFRPDFVPPWPHRSHMTPLTLTRLERPQVEALITHLAGGKALPAEVVAYIVARTDGVPLFVEELTKMLLESDVLHQEAEHYTLTGPLSAVTIPTTLQDSLMARLDRLPMIREVAQLGAVLGREFAYEMLRALAGVEDALLQERLAQLVETELLYQRGRPPHAKYIFKHALIQEAAYQSLLRSTRQQYHQRIAQVLEAQFPETIAAQPELLAHHYTEARLLEPAIPYWQRAGQRAIEHSAYREAIAHLMKGLALLQSWPDTPVRAQHELRLQIILGPALLVTKGYASPEAESAYVRARELCEQLGDAPQLFMVLLGLWRVYSVRPALEVARELAGHLLGIVHPQQDPTFPCAAHFALGYTLLCCGEFAPAREHLEQCWAHYDSQQHPAHVRLYGQDFGVTCQALRAWALWHLGYPDHALQTSREALTLARAVAHPYSLVLALSLAGALHLSRRERHAARDRAEELLALSTAHGFALATAWGTFLRGWVFAERGQHEEGMTHLRLGLAAWRATGTELWRPLMQAVLAETHGKTGQGEAGLTLLTDALIIGSKNGDALYEPELYRLKGLLLLSQSGAHHAEAEACFHQALDVARHQEAKSLELRAAMSLSRLWQQQGKRAEARDLLAPIYGWFTEGLDTADLQEAKALLEALEEGHHDVL